MKCHDGLRRQIAWAKHCSIWKSHVGDGRSASPETPVHTRTPLAASLLHDKSLGMSGNLSLNSLSTLTGKQIVSWREFLSGNAPLLSFQC